MAAKRTFKEVPASEIKAGDAIFLLHDEMQVADQGVANEGSVRLVLTNGFDYTLSAAEVVLVEVKGKTTSA